MYRVINRTCEAFNRRSRVLIQTPWHRRFGNASEEIYYGLLRAKRERKKAFFLYPRHGVFRGVGLTVTNRELFRLHSPYTVPNRRFGVFGIAAGSCLSVLFLALRASQRLRCSPPLRRLLKRIWRSVSEEAAWDRGYEIPNLGRASLWRPDGAETFSWRIVDELQWPRQHDEYRAPQLEPRTQRRAESIRIRMGIPLTEWFACLHVREHPWDKARNAAIQPYLPAVLAIIAAGGWVVRLGDESMTPLPPMDRVIDYPHTPYKSDVMDLYLLSQCRFFLGTNSGPTDAAALFRRPMVLVNVSEWAMGFPLKRGDLALLRHVYSKSRGRFLSIRELLEEFLDVPEITALPREYVTVNNTTDEITTVVEEFLAREEPYRYSALQETFNDGRTRQIRRWLDAGAPTWSAVSSENRLVEQYRLASRCEGTAGTVGRHHLEANWLVDTLQRGVDEPGLQPALASPGVSAFGRGH